MDVIVVEISVIFEVMDTIYLPPPPHISSYDSGFFHLHDNYGPVGKGVKG